MSLTSRTRIALDPASREFSTSSFTAAQTVVITCPLDISWTVEGGKAFIVAGGRRKSETQRWFITFTDWFWRVLRTAALKWSSKPGRKNSPPTRKRNSRTSIHMHSRLVAIFHHNNKASFKALSSFFHHDNWAQAWARRARACIMLQAVPPVNVDLSTSAVQSVEQVVSFKSQSLCLRRCFTKPGSFQVHSALFCRAEQPAAWM